MARTDLIPAAPIRRVVENWYSANVDYAKLDGPGTILLGNKGKVCALTGLAPDFLHELMSGRKKSIGFDVADRIVCCLHPDAAGGWRWEPDLWEIYRDYNLAALDRKSPCDRVAA